MGLLPAAEHDRDLNLRALVEESLDVSLLGVVVVHADLRPQLEKPLHAAAVSSSKTSTRLNPRGPVVAREVRNGPPLLFRLRRVAGAEAWLQARPGRVSTALPRARARRDYRRSRGRRRRR